MTIENRLNKYRVAKIHNELDEQCAVLRSMVREFPFNSEVSAIIEQEAHQLIDRYIDNIDYLIPLADDEIFSAFKMIAADIYVASDMAFEHTVKLLKGRDDKYSKYLSALLRNKNFFSLQKNIEERRAECLYEVYEVVPHETGQITLVVTDNLGDVGNELRSLEYLDDAYVTIWRKGNIVGHFSKRLEAFTQIVQVIAVDANHSEQRDVIVHSTWLAHAIIYALGRKPIYTDSLTISDMLTGYNADIREYDENTEVEPGSYIILDM